MTSFMHKLLLKEWSQYYFTFNVIFVAFVYEIKHYQSLTEFNERNKIYFELTFKAILLFFAKISFTLHFNMFKVKNTSFKEKDRKKKRELF